MRKAYLNNYLSLDYLKTSVYLKQVSKLLSKWYFVVGDTVLKIKLLQTSRSYHKYKVANTVINIFVKIYIKLGERQWKWDFKLAVIL